jgi:hypothetical protein
MNDELERTWKEVVDLVEVFARDLPDRTQEDLKSLTARMAGVPV